MKNNPINQRFKTFDRYIKLKLMPMSPPTTSSGIETIASEHGEKELTLQLGNEIYHQALHLLKKSAEY